MTSSIDPTLERWIALFRGPLCGLLASWGSDWREAEELAQDTFAETWLSREWLRGDPGDSTIVGPWLRGIARNLSLTQQRRARRRTLEALPKDIAAPTTETDERMDALRTGFRKLRRELQTVLRMFIAALLLALLGLRALLLAHRHSRAQLPGAMP